MGGAVLGSLVVGAVVTAAAWAAAASETAGRRRRGSSSNCHSSREQRQCSRTWRSLVKRRQVGLKRRQGREAENDKGGGLGEEGGGFSAPLISFGSARFLSAPLTASCVNVLGELARGEPDDAEEHRGGRQQPRHRSAAEQQAARGGGGAERER